MLIWKLENSPASAGVCVAPSPIASCACAIQRLEPDAAAVLDVELEAADRAEALHRRRREDRDERVLDRRRTAGSARRAIALRRKLRLHVRSSNGLSADEHDAAVRRVDEAVDREPGKRDRVARRRDASARSSVICADHGVGAIERGRVGSCAKATRYCLSCVGTKPCGTVVKPRPVSAEQADVDDQRDRRDAAARATRRAT